MCQSFQIYTSSKAQLIRGTKFSNTYFGIAILNLALLTLTKVSKSQWSNKAGKNMAHFGINF